MKYEKDLLDLIPSLTHCGTCKLLTCRHGELFWNWKMNFSIFSRRRSVEHRKYILFFLWNYYSKFLNPWNMLVSKMFIGFYFNALKYAILNSLTIWRENKNYLYIWIFCAEQDQESPINLQSRIKKVIWCDRTAVKWKLIFKMGP